MLKRGQVHGSRDSAEATALLLRRVVENFSDGSVSKLVNTVQQVGERLQKAAPKELAVGNIIRRVLGLIREEAEEDREAQSATHGEARLGDPSNDTESAPIRKIQNRRTLDLNSGAPNQDGGLNPTAAGRPIFGLLSQPTSNVTVLSETPSAGSSAQIQPMSANDLSKLDATQDLKAEVVEGILEILEELKQADEQIAGFALEHIHSNEIILTHSSSETVRKFLLKAASKRKFTVIHAESYPNGHEATHALATAEKSKANEEKASGQFQKTLTAAGISVILIPDSAVYAMMSRANKVILDSHAVFANGGLISDAGAKQMANAAHTHRTPVMILSGIYKFSPIYPFNIDAFLEDGDPSKIVPFDEGDLMREIKVENPLFDYVPAELIDLYVTNLGGHAPSYLYRIIADHYRSEDIELESLEPHL